jgi:hypothetical protein
MWPFMTILIVLLETWGFYALAEQLARPYQPVTVIYLPDDSSDDEPEPEKVDTSRT